MSSSFWVGMAPSGPEERLEDSRLLRMLRRGLSRPVKPRLWVDWGLRRDGGFHNAVIEANAAARSREFVELLRRRHGFDRSNLRDFEDRQGGHSESCWRRRLPDALRFMTD